MAQCFVRVFPTVEVRRVCTPSWKNDLARLEVYRWAISLKLLQNPGGATKNTSEDPPQLLGSAG